MKRTIDAIVTHCAATPNGKNFTISDINLMHKARGFKRSSQYARNFNPELKYVGYHFFICTNGDIQTGRHIEEIGAHVFGHNANTIGICMAGTDKFTQAQWMSLRTCHINLSSIIQNNTHATAEGALNAFKDMGIKLKGHRDYSPDLNHDGIIQSNEFIKVCPGFSVSEWIKGGMMPLENHLV